MNLLEPGKWFEFYPDFKANVYCMYSFTSNLCEKTIRVDPRNYEFGDSFVLINNVPAFMERMLNGLRKNGFVPHWNLVKYYDDELNHEKLSVFNKPNRFEHQSELRFLVENSIKSVVKFSIGSLEDISELHPITTLQKMTFEIVKDSDQFRFCFHS